MPDTSLSSELRLLLAACHVGPYPPAPPSERMDAALLPRLAAFHRVGSLAYEARERLGLDAETTAALQRMTMATLHRNLQFAAELKIALRALAAADVPVILLKGAHLMDAVYHNPALRPLSDLDLLIRPEHVHPALAALGDAGYTTDGKKAAFGLAADREIRLDKTGVHEVVIELHTDLNRPTRHQWFPMDALWERSVDYPFEGAPARALGWADNLCFLCAHAVPHAFAQLIWLRDIAGVWGTGTMDGGWGMGDANAVPQAARDAHTGRAVYAGLTLAKRLLGAAVDDALLEDLGGGDAADLEPWLDPARLLGGTHYSTMESLRFRAAMADTRRDGASILRASLGRKASEFRQGLTPRKARGTGE